MQKTQYQTRAESGSVSTQRLDTIAEVVGKKVDGGGVDVWSRVPLVIPPVDASRLDGCRLINITYVFEVGLITKCSCNN